MPPFVPSFTPNHSLISVATQADLLEKLRGGSFPHDDESKVPVLDLLSKLNAELGKFDRDIISLENELKLLKKGLGDLKEERSKFNLHAQYCHSLLSPIRRLPSDVLIRIFQLAIEGEPISLSDDKPPLELPILKFSHVCSAWRSIAHYTPGFWNRIEIYDLELKPSQFERYGNFLQWLVEKSRDSSLHIELSFVKQVYNDPDVTEDSDDSDTDDEDSDATDILQLNKQLLAPLLQQSHRYRSLSIDLQGEITKVLELYQPMKDRLDGLVRLQVDMPYRISDKDDFSPISLFETSPSLTEVILHPSKCSPGFRDPLLAIPLIPWKQLKSLLVRHQTMFLTQHILSECCNLTSLEIKANYGNYQNSDNGAGQELTTLSTLEDFVYSANRNDQLTIFRYLVLPSLKKLTFNNASGITIDRWPLAVENFGQMVANSALGDSLSSLSLSSYANLPNIDPIPILRLLPSLEFLALDEEGTPVESGYASSMDTGETRLVSAKLLVALCEPSKPGGYGSSRVLLPNLKQLRLLVYEHGFGHDACKFLLNTRCDPERSRNLEIAKLEKVVLRFKCSQIKKAREHYASLIARGLDIRVIRAAGYM